jgi:adenylate kinase family enzyme
MTDCLSFIGPPGSSKTTQIHMLMERLGAGAGLVASVPRLVRGEPELGAMLTTEERERVSRLRPAAIASRDAGRLCPIELDEILFRAAARVRSRVVAFDGCPRGLRQARLLLTVDDLARRTCVIELAFPSKVADMSIERQHSRELATRGAGAAAARQTIFERKLQTFLEETLPGLAVLRSAGVRTIRVDATQSREDIAVIVQMALAHMAGSAQTAVALA